MIVETNRLAASPASWASAPREPRDRVGEEERVAGAGRVDRAVDRHRVDPRRHVAGEDHRPLGAEREHDLGDAERPQRRLVGPAAELLGLLVVELQRGDVTEDRRGRSTPSLTSGPIRAVAHEPLGVDDQPVAARGERGERLEREVLAGERADDDPRRVADRVADPAGDVVGRPGVAELVELHDPPVTVVVEREPGRPLGRPPAHREAELLELRHDAPRGPRRPSGRRARRPRPGRLRGARGRSTRPRRPGARRRAGDDVEHEVPDDRSARHARI